MHQPNPYLQNLQSFIHRQFILDMMPPPSEPAFRQSRECLAEPVKKRFPFPVVIGFIGMGNSVSIEMQKAYIRANSNHGTCFIPVATEQDEKANTEWLDRAKFEALQFPIIPTIITTIEEDSQKEKYHRKNKIEKRRRKR
jgi:hypothetical protein